MRRDRPRFRCAVAHAHRRLRLLVTLRHAIYESVPFVCGSGAWGVTPSPLAIHERSECVARGPKAEPLASARETCEGSVGTDAPATHIDGLDACTRPDIDSKYRYLHASADSSAG
jgi:hypothetical protein